MKHRHALMLLGAVLPICVLLRTIQLCFTIDVATGFIKQQYSAIGVTLTVIVCAAAASVGLLAATLESMKPIKATTKPIVAIASVLMGGMFIYQTVSGISDLQNGMWRNVLLVFLTLMCAVVFFAYGLKNIYDYNMPTIMLAVPVVYYVVKLINDFVSTSELARVTENVFILFTSSVVLWFMFEFASFENNVGDTDKKPKKLFASGLAAVILCAVTSVPKFLFAAISGVELSVGDISASLLNAVMGIFILIYIVCNFSGNDVQTKPISKHSA